MKKFILDLVVRENIELNRNYFLLKLTTNDGAPLPEMLPGQFAEIRIDNSQSVFLRRPISINYVDKISNELWLLVQKVGNGTNKLSQIKAGELLNLVLPLGSSFTIPSDNDKKLLLIGGGVGTAPMLYLGSRLKELGFEVTFLLGARTKNDLLQLNQFEMFGKVFTTTEDGSHGEKGYVTQHSVLKEKIFDQIYTCGPKPMMKAVASYAYKNDIECEVSLENTMACGIGVCLCCVEKTTEGHVCVCKDGPVMNIKKLLWQN
ncbi:MAG: dihydroorotate dehydrogenase electron transfer subunit [Bacteroidales bacterium]|nr:dihydroorotate dehydrogenase electron transfer subunit [Bacteroidales bacterium]